MKLPFHDQIEKWFLDKYSSPTPIQEMSWDSISQGYHTLLSAPTGSGKTLAAFLWAIHKLIDQKEHQEGIPILYISPLKALNNDIEKNLNAPLKELQDYFEQNQLEFPQIQVAVRSGDTPQQDRRKMLKNPPDILITTPESLHILLTSPNGRRFLQGIQTVILDEIHAILESRRGVLLSTAMERLVHLNGEFQRIGLSATVQPMERAARFLGGYQSQGDKGWLARDVKILMDSGNKKYEIQVISPPEGEEDEER